MYEISAILASLGVDESCSVCDIVNQDKGRSTTDIIAYLESKMLTKRLFLYPDTVCHLNGLVYDQSSGTTKIIARTRNTQTLKLWRY